MNNKNLSTLDPQQMLHRTFDDAIDAQRVYIVNAQDLTGTIKVETPDWSKMAWSPPPQQVGHTQIAPIQDVIHQFEYKELRVPEIIREVQVVQVPQIIKEIEYREIEKTVLVTEYKTIEVPVVIKEIQIIEKPVVVVERVLTPFPMFFKVLIVIQTATSILFTLLMLRK